MSSGPRIRPRVGSSITRDFRAGGKSSKRPTRPGDRVRTRMELEEPGELPPHRHRSAEESYEVIAGELEVQVEGDWSTVETGETVVVPPDTDHAFRTT